jgi:hypothetical protein
LGDALVGILSTRIGLKIGGQILIVRLLRENNSLALFVGPFVWVLRATRTATFTTAVVFPMITILFSIIIMVARMVVRLMLMMTVMIRMRGVMAIIIVITPCSIGLFPVAASLKMMLVMALSIILFTGAATRIAARTISSAALR